MAVPRVVAPPTHTYRAVGSTFGRNGGHPHRPHRLPPPGPARRLAGGHPHARRHRDPQHSDRPGGGRDRLVPHRRARGPPGGGKGDAATARAVGSVRGLHHRRRPGVPADPLDRRDRLHRPHAILRARGRRGRRSAGPPGAGRRGVEPGRRPEAHGPPQPAGVRGRARLAVRGGRHRGAARPLDDRGRRPARGDRLRGRGRRAGRLAGDDLRHPRPPCPQRHEPDRHLAGPPPRVPAPHRRRPLRQPRVRRSCPGPTVGADAGPGATR